MNECKTLHELCDQLGVSRRAVQGYEKAGLVAASSKNKYGHLLYDDEAQERIAKIKLYQRFGFSIREISLLLDAPESTTQNAIKNQIVYLKEQRKQIDLLIKEATRIVTVE